MTIVEPSKLYDCKLHDDVFVGPFVEIQSKLVLEKNEDTVTLICMLKVNIGDDCFIGHGVMFINDLFLSGGPAEVMRIFGVLLK